MSNNNSQQIKKLKEYKTKKLLVLVIRDDELLIYRTLERLAYQHKSFPDELFVINVGKKTERDIRQNVGGTNKKRVSKYTDFMTTMRSSFSDYKFPSLLNLETIDSRDWKEKESIVRDRFEEALFNRKKLANDDIIRDKKVREKIEIIYNDFNKREEVFRDINFEYSPDMGAYSNKDHVKKLCKGSSEYVKSFEIQNTARVASTGKIRNRVDVICSEYSIQVCMQTPSYDVLVSVAFLMGRVSFSHDTLSTVKSRNLERMTFGDGEELDYIDYDFLDHKTVPPSYIKNFQTRVDFLKIERSGKERDNSISQEEEKSTESDSNSNDYKKPPKVKIYTKKHKDKGSVARPSYGLTIKSENIYLTIKPATYLYTWLNVKTSMLLNPNINLGYMKAMNMCKLLGANIKNIKNNVDMVKYIAKEFPGQMAVLVGREASKELPKKASTPPTKKVSKEPTKKDEQYDINEINQVLLVSLEKQNKIGGYLGGKTESDDNTDFKKVVLAQLENKELIDWLLPKSITEILKSKHEFSALDESPKANDKKDLVNFLHRNKCSWNVYKKILNKFELSDQKQVEPIKSKNPNPTKKYVYALTDFEIDHKDDQYHP